MTVALLAVVLYNGLGVFWPWRLALYGRAVGVVDAAQIARIEEDGTLVLVEQAVTLEGDRLAGLRLFDADRVRASLPDGSLRLVNELVVAADATVTFPDGTRLRPDRTGEYADGTPIPEEALRLLQFRAALVDLSAGPLAVEGALSPLGLVAAGGAPPGPPQAVTRLRPDGSAVLGDGSTVPLQTGDGRSVSAVVDGGALLVELVGRPVREDVNPDTGVARTQLKIGNRETRPQQMDFRWYVSASLRSVAYPEDLYVVERMSYGDFYGYLDGLETPTLPGAGAEGDDAALSAALAAVRTRERLELEPVRNRLNDLSGQLERIRHETLRAGYRRDRALARELQAEAARWAHALDRLAAREAEVMALSDEVLARRQEIESDLRQNVALFVTGDEQTATVSLLDIVRAYRPNAMNPWQQTRHVLAKGGELLFDEPREANTEGGIFPAIFGTVLLVFLMAISCFPLGVLAGVYLGEYAKDGPLVRTVRIAVNNLAGIPSIVYGIFGLGFFVYGMGGLIDTFFFPERVAAHEPVFGTGGILWASLTLGLLTIPVVIVSTEEALRAIPREIREGSLALGATKLQTLLRVMLPMASPGIMTGFILAMARAAGEVAPLMITGVVKVAPNLPLDSSFPYLHVDRKFMHLGFHIFDLAFQSPNAEAALPMVYTTTLLLLLIVLSMSSVAIYLRNRMRRRFQVRTM